MITEIVSGKTYKDNRCLRTVVFFDDNVVFYKYSIDGDYGWMTVDTFKSIHYEIPEAPKKFYQITYKLKHGMIAPCALEHLYVSKEEFFKTSGAKKEGLEFFNMTEIVNQVGEL